MYNADSVAVTILHVVVREVCGSSASSGNYGVMRVEINHKPVEVKPGVATLGALLKDQEMDGKGRAVAVNNSVVPHAQWDSYELADGMKITVIRAVCGG